MSSWGENNRIAIIDDSVEFCIMARKALIKLGYAGEIKCYPFARAFYESGESLPDLVVCDLNMPRYSGFDVHDWLVDHGFGGSFILVSADAQLLEDSFTRLRDVDVFIKPIIPKTFVERVKSCLVK